MPLKEIFISSYHFKFGCIRFFKIIILLYSLLWAEYVIVSLFSPPNASNFQLLKKVSTPIYPQFYSFPGICCSGGPFNWAEGLVPQMTFQLGSSFGFGASSSSHVWVLRGRYSVSPMCYEVRRLEDAKIWSPNSRNQKGCL